MLHNGRQKIIANVSCDVNRKVAETFTFVWRIAVHNGTLKCWVTGRLLILDSYVLLCKCVCA